MIKMVDLNKLCLISYFIIFELSQEGMNAKETLNGYDRDDLRFEL